MSINIKIPKYEYSLIIDQKLFPIIKLVINKTNRNKKILKNDEMLEFIL